MLLRINNLRSPRPPLPLFLQHWSNSTPSDAEHAEASGIPKTQGQKPANITKGNVLFVSRQRIAGRINGSSAYLLDLAEAVRRAGFTPHLLQPSPDLMGRWPFMRLRSEMKVFQTHKIRGVLRIGRWVVTRDPRVGWDALRGVASQLARRFGVKGNWVADRPRPYAISASWTQADRAFTKRSAAADIVIADYAFQAEAFELFPGRPSAIVMHDLFHAREAKGARDSVAHIDRAAELALLSRADAVIAIQSTEARFLRDHVSSTRAILAQMTVHAADDVQLGDGNRLLFVGSQTAPNVVGLKWMFDAVWPRLREHSLQFKLDVVGAVSSAFPRGGPPGVTFHGVVDDLTSFYAQAGVVISPLTFGSGLKIKLIEALAKGKAVVATSITLQGVERECEGGVAHADDPVSFANAILALGDDDRRRTLAQSALAIARDHFSPRSCHADFIAWLEDSRPKPSTVCRTGPFT